MQHSSYFSEHRIDVLHGSFGAFEHDLRHHEDLLNAPTHRPAGSLGEQEARSSQHHKNTSQCDCVGVQLIDHLIVPLVDDRLVLSEVCDQEQVFEVDQFLQNAELFYVLRIVLLICQHASHYFIQFNIYDGVNIEELKLGVGKVIVVVLDAHFLVELRVTVLQLRAWACLRDVADVDLLDAEGLYVLEQSEQDACKTLVFFDVQLVLLVKIDQKLILTASVHRRVPQHQCLYHKELGDELPLVLQQSEVVDQIVSVQSVVLLLPCIFQAQHDRNKTKQYQQCYFRLRFEVLVHCQQVLLPVHFVRLYRQLLQWLR